MTEQKQVIPEGYKQTEIGVIPNDWKVACVSDICEIYGRIGFRGYTKADIVSQEQGVLSISPSNILDGNMNFTHGTYITKQKYEESPEIKIFNADILLVKTGSTFGKTAIVRNLLENATLNPQVVVLKNLSCDNFFFSYMMQFSTIQDQIKNTIVGGAIPTLSQKEVLAFKFPLPSRIEQTAIANALSDVDVLISELEKLIAKKQAIKTATMQQLLTGKTRLPEFALREDGTPKGYKQSELGEIPEDWEVLAFGDIAKPSPSRVNPKVYGGGDFCIELEHISQGKGVLLGDTITTHESSLKNTFESGDVLFGKLRAYLRKYWLATKKGVCSTEVWVLKSEQNRSISEYIFYIVQTDKFIDAASEAYGTHMPRADWKVVREYLIALPNIAEQSAISTVLTDIDGELRSLQQRLNKTRQIKQGMMQELLTGKTRLVKPEVTTNA